MSLNIAMRAIDEATALRPELRTKPVPSPFGLSMQIEDEIMSVLYDYFERCMIAVVFCFQSLEAFCNEVIDHRTPENYEFVKANGTRVRGNERLQSDVSLADKLGVLLPAILGATSPIGTPLWDGFEALKRARHSTVHAKASQTNPRIRNVDDLENQTLLEQFVWSNLRPWVSATIELIAHFERNYVVLDWLTQAKAWTNGDDSDDAIATTKD